MATTSTLRLGLKKQENGDNPGAWEVDLNLGFDDADDRLFRTGSGDPDSVETSDYVGQRYLDTASELWYTAQTLGAAADWASDFDILDLLITHPTPPTTYNTFGMLLGHWEYTSVTSYTLEPIVGTTIYIEIDVAGELKQLSNVGDMVFDIVANAHGPAEAASTVYYMYVEDDDDDGTIDKHVSSVAPYDISGTKPGYHPTENTWRCIGSMFNDSGQDVAKGYWGRDGLFILDAPTRDQADHLYPLTKSTTASLLQQAVNIPLTCTHFLLDVYMEAAGQSGGSYCAFGQDDATAALPLTVPPHKLSDALFVECTHILLIHNPNDGNSARIDMPVVTRNAPAFRYGMGRATTVTELEAMMIGWYDIWAPKGF